MYYCTGAPFYFKAHSLGVDREADKVIQPTLKPSVGTAIQHHPDVLESVPAGDEDTREQKWAQAEYSGRIQ
jgi:hypothetical protein